jgi:hypothetical protein
LTRHLKDGDPLSYVNFVLLNPSTATATEDDPTIRRCIGFAERWGYPSLVVTNLFALRSTDPRALRTSRAPVGPDNDHWLMKSAMGADRIVAAWGNHGRYLKRGAKVLWLGLPRPVYCFGLTKVGEPKHPLYLRKDADLEIMEG